MINFGVREHSHPSVLGDGISGFTNAVSTIIITHRRLVNCRWVCRLIEENNLRVRRVRRRLPDDRGEIAFWRGCQNLSRDNLLSVRVYSQTLIFICVGGVEKEDVL